MEMLPLATIAVLTGIALLLILYPIWQQTRSEATLPAERSGQTLAEYQARYQAALAAIKDLKFDYEMGKMSATDYERLLQRAKLEAANIRHQIDLLSHDPKPEIEPELEAEIEKLIAKTRGDTLKTQKSLPPEIETDIELLKNTVQNPVCPNCSKIYQAGDAFCSGCGQPLPQVQKAVCPNCGYTLQPDDAFCAKCGTALNAKTQTEEQEEARVTEPSI